MAVTRYLWDIDTDTILMETDENDQTTAVYNSEPVLYGRLLSQRRGSTTSYYKYDAQHSTRLLTDDTQTVTDSYTYTAFGETVATTGTTVNTFCWAGRFGYYFDGDQIGHWIRERRYISAAYRWMSVDPNGVRDGFSLYCYCKNSPLTYADPSGLIYIDPSGHRGSENTTLDDLEKILVGIASTAACKDEAMRIARAIKYTFEKNNPWYWPTFGRDERNKGVFCYEWAYSFEDAANLESSGNCFHISVDAATSDIGGGDDLVHYWIKITPLNGTGQAIYVDDGFADGNYVHPKPPVPHGYELGNEFSRPRYACKPPPAYNCRGNIPVRRPPRPPFMPPTIFGPYFPPQPPIGRPTGPST